MNYYYYLDNLPNLKVGDKVYVDSPDYGVCTVIGFFFYKSFSLIENSTGHQWEVSTYRLTKLE